MLVSISKGFGASCSQNPTYSKPKTIPMRPQSRRDLVLSVAPITSK